MFSQICPLQVRAENCVAEVLGSVWESLQPLVCLLEPWNFSEGTRKGIDSMHGWLSCWAHLRTRGTAKTIVDSSGLREGDIWVGMTVGPEDQIT